MSRFVGRSLVVLCAGAFIGACAPETTSERGASTEQNSAAAQPVLASLGSGAPTVKVYRTPTCGCCMSWVEHMREAGFTVEVEDTNAIGEVKMAAGLPPQLQSCHTSFIGDYVFEGHVPAATIAKFLAEEPAAKGLAVPGMPVGSPGMEMGGRVDPYDVIAFDAEGRTAVYESRR